GINFAVASSVAEAAEVCLFDEAGQETRFRLPDYDGGAWHGFVPGIGPGIGTPQAYGFRVRGPYDTARGLRCNPAKLLLDPSARAVRGEVSFGPEVFAYSWDDHDAPSALASAPHAAYSAAVRAGSHGGQVAEFKAMVKALHEAGLEVILDVVFNHTAEGGEGGPSLCFRGLDNTAYYRLNPGDPGQYYDTTGTGNSLNAGNPVALRLIMDSLRYWLTEMHVDGFRFDLATTLARQDGGFSRLSALFA